MVGDVRDPAAVRRALPGGGGGLPPRRRRRRRPEHVRDRRVHQRQQPGDGGAAGGADREAGGAAGGGVQHEPLRRGALPRRGRPRPFGAPPRPRPAPAGGLGGARRGGALAVAGADAGEQDARPLVGLRALEVRPGAPLPDDRRDLRHPRRGPALLQRLRPPPGAVQPLHRRAGDLRLAPAQRQSAADLRGRRAAAGLRQRPRHRPGVPAGLRGRGRRGRRRGVQRRQRRVVLHPRACRAHGRGARPLAGGGRR